LGRFPSYENRRHDLRKILLVTGLFLGLLFFVGANMHSYHRAEPPCCDGIAAFGFPLSYGTFGGYVGATGYDFFSLFADVVISLGASAIFALLFAKVAPTILASCRQLAFWHGRTRL